MVIIECGKVYNMEEGKGGARRRIKRLKDRGIKLNEEEQRGGGEEQN